MLKTEKLNVRSLEQGKYKNDAGGSVELIHAYFYTQISFEDGSKISSSLDSDPEEIWTFFNDGKRQYSLKPIGTKSFHLSQGITIGENLIFYKKVD